MGELILPDPRLCGLDSEFTERFREISGHLSRLNARDLRSKFGVVTEISISLRDKLLTLGRPAR